MVVGGGDDQEDERRGLMGCVKKGEKRQYCLDQCDKVLGERQYLASNRACKARGLRKLIVPSTHWAGLRTDAKSAVAKVSFRALGVLGAQRMRALLWRVVRGLQRSVYESVMCSE